MEIDPPNREQGKTQKGAIDVDRTPRKKAPPSAYNLFVKKHSASVRERLTAEREARGDLGKVPQTEVLKECGRLWKEHKARQK